MRWIRRWLEARRASDQLGSFATVCKPREEVEGVVSIKRLNAEGVYEEVKASVEEQRVNIPPGFMEEKILPKPLDLWVSEDHPSGQIFG